MPMTDILPQLLMLLVAFAGTGIAVCLLAKVVAWLMPCDTEDQP